MVSRSDSHHFEFFSTSKQIFSSFIIFENACHPPDEGDKIITGTSCSHMFHYECCMKWLENGNEHCPNCRTDMMTSDELFQAALDELGEARIMKAARRYETAILRHRLEALTRQHQEASRTANESNNSNVHLHQPSQ